MINMKTSITIFWMAFVALTSYFAGTFYTPTEITVETSIGGTVFRDKLSINKNIHLVFDKDRKLVDIQAN